GSLAQGGATVEAEVHRVGVKVVQVEQQIHVERMDDFGDPGGFVLVTARWVDQCRDVFEQRRRTDHAARAHDVLRGSFDGRSRAGRRRKMTDLASTGAHECQVLRPALGLYALHDAAHRVEPILVYGDC